MNRFIEVNEEFLSWVEDAVASGAENCREISDSIGVKYKTFRQIKYGKRKNGKEEKRRIETAIKKGKERQRRNIFRKAEYNLIKLIEGYNYEEIDTVTTKSGDAIKDQKIRKVQKHVPPNITAINTALNNLSGGKYQNRGQLPNNEHSKGAFLKWLEEQEWS